jgi:hypothetical protein
MYEKWKYQASLFVIVSQGSTKAHGREPKSGLGQVFNIKLGYFAMYALAQHIQARPSLELKTRPRFCPVSLSLSMASHFNWHGLTH